MCFRITLLLLLEKHPETFEWKAVKYLRGLGFNFIYQKSIIVLGLKMLIELSFSSELFKFQIQPHRDSFRY